jgi:hypothetical protein
MISGCCITDDDDFCLEVDSEAIFSEEAEVLMVFQFGVIFEIIGNMKVWRGLPAPHEMLIFDLKGIA